MTTENLRPTYQLSNEERSAIFQDFLMNMSSRNPPKLKHGAINEISAKYNVSRVSISKLWRNASDQLRRGEIVVDSSSMKRNCGRKKKNYDDKLKDIKNIPLNRRGTLRSLLCASGIPKTTLFRNWKERKLLKRVSSTVKPLLTDRNKIDRLMFCCPM